MGNNVLSNVAFTQQTLLSTYYVPETLLGSRNKVEAKAPALSVYMITWEGLSQGGYLIRKMKKVKGCVMSQPRREAFDAKR